MPKLPLPFSYSAFFDGVLSALVRDSLKPQFRRIFLGQSDALKFENHWRLANDLVSARQEVHNLKSQLAQAIGDASLYEAYWRDSQEIAQNAQESADTWEGEFQRFKSLADQLRDQLEESERLRYQELENAQKELEKNQATLRILESDFLNASQSLAEGVLAQRHLQDALTESNRINEQHFERHKILNRQNEELSNDRRALQNALHTVYRLVDADPGIEQICELALDKTNFDWPVTPRPALSDMLEVRNPYIAVDFAFELSSDINVLALYVDGQQFYPTQEVHFGLHAGEVKLSSALTG